MRHLHRRPSSVRRLRKRRLFVEALESRRLLDAEGLPWPAPNLTISFAPDGTSVAGYESRLFESLDAVGDVALWQDAIVRGFETWAQHTTASISTTNDSGDAFGTPGPTQGDSRFGDVRVAAVPMSNDIIAMSVPHDEVISGTWAGDILFNSNAELNSIDDIFAVAVHEAGHVFGLGHSTDPNSPMYLHGIASVVIPTAADIHSLQRLYGVSIADGGSEYESDGGSDGGSDLVEGDEPTLSEHDREHSDDRLSTANSVMLSANFQGAIRYDAAGQIFEANDVDFYRLAPIAEKFEHEDVLTVTVRAATPEGLIPTMIIRDDEGEVVESKVLANANGEFIIQARDADPRKAHFLEVKAADETGSHATGSYDFLATFGSRTVALNRIAKGTLKPEQPTRSRVLHVSETRLVHFVLATDPVKSSAQSFAWIVIYDANGSPIFRTAARPGESRSANTVLLTPGDYELEFSIDAPDGTKPVEIDYRLFSRSISLPVGPDPIDPTILPILPCSDPGSDPVYCYPDDVTIIDPLILPSPTPIILPEPVTVILPPWFDPSYWYWDGVNPPNDLPAPIGTAPQLITISPKLESGPVSPSDASASGSGESNGANPISTNAAWQNSALPQDVNGDNQVSPIDALLVINFLNASGPQSLLGDHPSGSAFLDVNNDSSVSPIDALLVINELNQPASIAAEGEAVTSIAGHLISPQSITPLAAQTFNTRSLADAKDASSGSVRPAVSTLLAASGTQAILVAHGTSSASSDRRPSKLPSPPSLEEAIALIASERSTS